MIKFTLSGSMLVFARLTRLHANLIPISIGPMQQDPIQVVQGIHPEWDTTLHPCT